MEILQKTNITRDARIKTLRSSIQLRLKRSMQQQEALGLENLVLENPAAPQNTSRANEGKGRPTEDNASLQSALQQASGQHTSSISSCDPSAVPSYQPLPIAPLRISAGTLNHWPSQVYHDGFVQVPPGDPRYHRVQTFNSPPDPSSVSRYQPEGINEPSNFPRVTAVPFVPPRLPSRGPGPTVQKSSLYSNSNASPQLTEATPRQHEKFTSSPPANCRSSRSTKARDLQPTTPATRKPSPPKFGGNDDLIHLPAPIPTSAYLSDSHGIPHLLSSPQRLLLVLDLNGTLLYRPRASQNYTPRPCLSRFLKYSFANHSLLVWSSAQPNNVKGVCTRLFSRGQREMLLGEWGRDTLGLTPAQYKARVQVYKRLDRIWGDESLQHSHPDFEGGARWGQHNTVLIDDSALKASAQPFNHVQVPEFMRGGGEQEGDGRDVLGQVVGYLEEVRKWSDVSGYMTRGPFEVDTRWRWEWPKKKPQGA